MIAFEFRVNRNFVVAANPYLVCCVEAPGVNRIAIVELQCSCMKIICIPGSMYLCYAAFEVVMPNKSVQTDTHMRTHVDTHTTHTHTQQMHLPFVCLYVN